MTQSASRKVAIVQARMGSKRLPGKVLADLDGRPALEFMLERVRRASNLDAVWVATTTEREDDKIERLCEELSVSCYRGPVDDVLKRYFETAQAAGADLIVRLTSDCPFAEPGLIDSAVNAFTEASCDYLSNVIVRTYPDGLDVEVFDRATLERTQRETDSPRFREHVTPYMRTGHYPGQPSGGFRVAHLKHDQDFSHLRWTLDEPEDLGFFRQILPYLPAQFTWLDVIAALTAHPKLLCWNRQKKYRLGALADLRENDPTQPFGVDRSNEMLDRALETIPLASQTFSKSHQQMVAGASPLFIERGKGCRVFDVDGNQYIDYVMGLLPVVLGYADPDVDAAVVRQLENGMTFSLPSPLEADLAERLVGLIPCAEMVRFGKNGSDATTAAVRLARAHTGRDKVAVSGYHGWHDWYIGSTTRSLGVPEAVQALTVKFPFNDADALERLLSSEPDGFAAVIVEPTGAEAPDSGFLGRVRSLTEKYGVVLIFDEIITGFRIDMGGAQARFGVTPDLASFGKAMANGMPISAVVGQASIMRGMEDIFFSATFGGETLSIAAALATIDKLERSNVVSRLWHRGEVLRDGANRLLDCKGFGDCLQFRGDGWWPRLTMHDPPVDAVLMRSLLRQEFVANGLLLMSSMNLCLAHDSDAVSKATLAAIETSLDSVKDALDAPDPARHLRGMPIQPTFTIRP